MGTSIRVRVATVTDGAATLRVLGEGLAGVHPGEALLAGAAAVPRSATAAAADTVAQRFDQAVRDASQALADLGLALERSAAQYVAADHCLGRGPGRVLA